MPCQASAKTGVIVAQLCWYTVPYVSSSYAACIHARCPRYVRVYARTNAHACMHVRLPPVEEVRRWASTRNVAWGRRWRDVHRCDRHETLCPIRAISSKRRGRRDRGLEDRCQPVIAWIDDYHALDTTK